MYLSRLALEEGDVSAFLDSEEEEPRLASSLLHLPTYIKVNNIHYFKWLQNSM